MSTIKSLGLGLVFLTIFIQNIISDTSNMIYTGKVKTLVLVDDWHYLDTHSLFWDQLKSIKFFS